ncbi:ESSS subunit of NADH:ubiquinone oxidoreductase-domain-containing protein [Xylariaceae sp. FL0804]|nr:ESSS subunit of NADH:ubiquinone oxidoreductase-domain-containing protein [Xylariaceae sp. FL0804]
MSAVVRPSTAAAAARRAATAASSGTAPTTTTTATRSFSASARASSGHGPQLDPPTGWLWGVRPGEKYQKEGWEGPFFYGFCGSLVLAGIAYGFKPDTSIQTWALEEARRRLEAEGILEDPTKKP